MSMLVPHILSSELPDHQQRAERDWAIRLVALFVSLASLIYGAVLAWRTDVNGVAVGSVFAVAVIALVYGATGLMPASIKIGDVEVALEKAKADAKREGEEEGKKSGGLAGLESAVGLVEAVRNHDVSVDEARDRIKTALDSELPLLIEAGEVPTLHVPNLGSSDAARAADRIVEGLLPE